MRRALTWGLLVALAVVAAVLAFLPAAVWLVPMWLVWVVLGAMSVLRPRSSALLGFALATLHGLQHLGQAGPFAAEDAHLAVEVLLLWVLVALPWQYRRDVQQLATRALTAYVREPLPPLPVFPTAAAVRGDMYQRAA